MYTRFFFCTCLFSIEQKIAPVIEDKYDPLVHSVRLSERHHLEVCFGEILGALLHM
jgi:hypothetical protein